MVTTDEGLRSIKDVDFPASKDDLLASAQRGGASEEVLRALRAVPPVDYANKDEVARSVPTDEPRDAHTAAEQSIGQAESRIAAGERETGTDPFREAL